MAIFTFALGIVLMAAGLGGLMASIDLLPTELGLLYAGCGAVALCAGGVTLAIGALIHRLGVLRVTIESAQPREAWPATGAPPLTEAAPHEPPPSVAFEEAAEPAAFEQESSFEAEPDAALEREEEEAVNENRAGHLPTMSEIEHALAEREPEPTLVGRYSAGGASYMIFSDGSIEAETENGAYRFSSMSEFKAYLAGRRG